LEKPQKRSVSISTVKSAGRIRDDQRAQPRRQRPVDDAHAVTDAEKRHGQIEDAGINFGAFSW